MNAELLSDLLGTDGYKRDFDDEKRLGQRIRQKPGRPSPEKNNIPSPRRLAPKLISLVTNFFCSVCITS